MATLNGSVDPNNDSDSDVVQFCYSETDGTAASICASGTAVAGSTTPATGTTTIDESASLTGLTPGTTYYFVLEATDQGGTTYSTVSTFFTTSNAPTVATSAATNVELDRGHPQRLGRPQQQLRL